MGDPSQPGSVQALWSPEDNSLSIVSADKGTLSAHWMEDIGLTGSPDVTDAPLYPQVDLVYIADPIYLPKDSSHLFAGEIKGIPTALHGARYEGFECCNTSRVVSMEGIFAGMKRGNPDVSTWDVSSLINARDLFRNSPQANPQMGAWEPQFKIQFPNAFDGAISYVPDFDLIVRLSNIPGPGEFDLHKIFYHQEGRDRFYLPYNMHGTRFEDFFSNSTMQSFTTALGTFKWSDGVFESDYIGASFQRGYWALYTKKGKVPGSAMMTDKASDFAHFASVLINTGTDLHDLVTIAPAFPLKADVLSIMPGETITKEEVAACIHEQTATGDEIEGHFRIVDIEGLDEFSTDTPGDIPTEKQPRVIVEYDEDTPGFPLRETISVPIHIVSLTQVEIHLDDTFAEACYDTAAYAEVTMQSYFKPDADRLVADVFDESDPTVPVESFQGTPSVKIKRGQFARVRGIRTADESDIEGVLVPSYGRYPDHHIKVAVHCQDQHMLAKELHYYDVDEDGLLIDRSELVERLEPLPEESASNLAADFAIPAGSKLLRFDVALAHPQVEMTQSDVPHDAPYKLMLGVVVAGGIVRTARSLHRIHGPQAY